MDPNAQPVMQQEHLTVSVRPPLPKILLSVLGVIIVLGLIGMSYYLGTQKNTNTVSQEKATANYPTPTITSIPTTTPTLNIDSTSSWKTYSNAFFNITLKYPSAWEIIDQKSQTVFNQGENKNMRTDDITLGLKDQSVTLGMEFTENDNFKSSEDFLNFPSPINESEKIQVQGISAHFYTAFNEGPMPAKGYWTYVSFFNAGKEYNTYLVSSTMSQEELMKKITSTIRFTN